MAINSFDACVTAGYPIQESYPEQCRTPDGKIFVKRPAGTMCVQVITAAKNPKTGEIADFPTPCDVPLGWEILPPESAKQFCGGIAGVECPAGYRCKLDGNYPDAGGICVK